MKLFILAAITVLGGSLVFFSIPRTTIATLTVTVVDQNNRKIKAGISATYFDGDGNKIIEITPQTRGSWDNTLHWWSHSFHKTSLMRPQDGLRATSLEIKAKDCKSTTIPVTLKRQYEPLSLSPHGGGAAYYIYEFKNTVALKCP